MNAKTSQANTLEQVVDQTAQCVASMLECLLAERENLIARNSEAIQESTKNKLALFDRLEQLEARRHDLILAAGFSEDGGMDRLLAQTANSARVKLRWNQVLDDLAACRDVNQINGGILELGRRQAEQALAILRGQVAQPRLYGAGGDTSVALGNRELGKA